MNIDIREHVINNFKSNTEDEIKEAIIASLDAKDDITLPGLGVFFELLWKESDETTRETILNKLKTSLT